MAEPFVKLFFDLIFLLAARGSLLGVAWAGPFAKIFLFHFFFLPLEGVGSGLGWTICKNIAKSKPEAIITSLAAVQRQARQKYSLKNLKNKNSSGNSI